MSQIMCAYLMLTEIEMCLLFLEGHLAVCVPAFSYIKVSMPLTQYIGMVVPLT